MTTTVNRPPGFYRSRFKCSSIRELKAADRLPVHELSAVNGHCLRFKCRATPAQARAEVVGDPVAANTISSTNKAETCAKTLSLRCYRPRSPIETPTSKLTSLVTSSSGQDRPAFSVYGQAINVSVAARAWV